MCGPAPPRSSREGAALLVWWLLPRAELGAGQCWRARCEGWGATALHESPRTGQDRPQPTWGPEPSLACQAQVESGRRQPWRGWQGPWSETQSRGTALCQAHVLSLRCQSPAGAEAQRDGVSRSRLPGEDGEGLGSAPRPRPPPEDKAPVPLKATAGLGPVRHPAQSRCCPAGSSQASAREARLRPSWPLCSLPAWGSADTGVHARRRLHGVPVPAHPEGPPAVQPWLVALHQHTQQQAP